MNANKTLDYLLVKLPEWFCANNYTKTGPNHRAKVTFFPRTLP